MLLILFLITSTVVTSSNIRKAKSQLHTTKSTLKEALKDYPSLTEWTNPISETLQSKTTRRDLIARKGAKQQMTLSTGTSVTLWAPDQLTPEELSEAAKTVNHLAKEVSDCFCTFRAKRPTVDLNNRHSTIEPHAEQNCVCTTRSGLNENVPDLLPTDFYGTTLSKKSTMQSLIRYEVPNGMNYQIPIHDLVLALDAGDRRSYDARNPSVLKNIAANDDNKPIRFNNEGHLHGFIGFNATEGGGSLRLGHHGDRDYIICKGLDISKPSMPKVTVEMWLKLNKYDHSTGRAFGNTLDQKTIGGRSFFLHNVLYGTDRNLDMPPNSFDPNWTGAHGRVGATANHLYDSEVAPPALHEWNQYVVVYQENEVIVYQNGMVISREAIYGDGDDTIATLGSSDFVIGNHEFQHKGGIYKLNAYVGLVRIWKNALDNNEISQLYEHSKERFLK